MHTVLATTLVSCTKHNKITTLRSITVLHLTEIPKNEPFILDQANRRISYHLQKIIVVLSNEAKFF